MDTPIVFDAEPIIAFLDDEPGSDVVNEWIDRVASGEIDGYISPITKTEILYVGTRVGFDPGDVQASLDRLEALGVTEFDPRECWRDAAALKDTHSMALGDAYALATAQSVDGTLLVGADDDFDDVTGRIERFREDPA